MKTIEIKVSPVTQIAASAKRINKGIASKFLALALLILFICPFMAKSQGCGAKTSFFMAGDSLMFSHELLTGASNYSLKIRKSAGGPWVQPVGDVVSGCSKINYFAVYLRNRPNDCQSVSLKEGAYLFQITAYNAQAGDSCVMNGSFFLTREQIWKTYSSWDVASTEIAPVLR